MRRFSFFPHHHCTSVVRRYVGAVLLFFSMLFFTVTFLDRQFPNVLGFATDISVEEIVSLTNQERAEQGLSTLEMDSKLAEAAHRKALDMFENDYWAHVSPDGKEPWDFIDESGYVYLSAGENLAKDFNHSDSVVRAWLKSPSHRENLLGDNFDEIGVAVVDGELSGFETTLVVQMFGRSQASYLASIGEEATAESRSQVESEQVAVQEEEATPTRIAKEESLDVSSPGEDYRPLVSTQARAQDFTSSPLGNLGLRDFALSASVVFIGFLALVLILDLITASRKGRARLSSYTFAHLLILLFLLLGIWYSQVGTIL
ncbi:MAG: CAP domain-containing protein [Patescibacteria group bacterium]